MLLMNCMAIMQIVHERELKLFIKTCRRVIDISNRDAIPTYEAADRIGGRTN